MEGEAMRRRCGWLGGTIVALVLAAALAPAGAFATDRASPPAVTGVDPPSGPTDRSISVTITGIAFTGAKEDDFGTVSASFSVKDDTTINAVSPPQPAGTVDITVTTDNVTSQISNADDFTSQEAPVVKAL